MNMSSVSKAIVAITKNQKVSYTCMVLLTIGSEAVFSWVSFQCPCNYQLNFDYGMMFLLGPAAVLLVLGLVFNITMWRLFTGYCTDKCGEKKGEKKEKEKEEEKEGCQCCCQCCNSQCLWLFLRIVCRACIGPLMWLSVALLNGSFYECAKSGREGDNLFYRKGANLVYKNKTNEELARAPCKILSKIPEDERLELLQILKAESQIIGTIIIIAVAILVFLATSIVNCCCYRVSYMQRTFWKRYKQIEVKTFETLTDEYATKLAKKNVESFLKQGKDSELFSFPLHEEWKKISGSSQELSKTGPIYYSKLHKYIDGGLLPVTAPVSPQ